MTTDLRSAWRALAQRPAFTAVIVVTLALGIGANTAIFSLVDGLLFGVVPFEQPQQLVYFNERSKHFHLMSVSYPDFLDWQERSRTFESIAAHRYQRFNLTGLDEPRVVQGLEASSELFGVLRVKPALGRTYTTEEDEKGGPRVAVISHRLWSRQLGGRTDVVGTPLRLDGQPFTVIGVMPEGFAYPVFSRRVDLWVPIGRHEEKGFWNRENHPGIGATGRLLPGVTLQRAQADLDRVASELEAEHPDTNTGTGVALRSLTALAVEDVRPAVLTLAGAVVLVLLIACVNVAGLQLARGAERGRELAVRGALGASPWQVGRQLLVESLLLAGAGALLGLAVARGLLEILLAALPPGVVPVHGRIAIDAPVLLFTAVTAVLTALLFGSVPVVQAWRADLVDALKRGSKGSAGVRRQRLRSALVVGEVALALVLLTGAGLFLRTLQRLTDADPGFDSGHVLVFDLSLPEQQYEDDASRVRLFSRLAERLDALPGVQRAGVTLPLLGGWQTMTIAEGQPPPAPGEEISPEVLRVTPGVLETLGLRLLRGRFLDDSDRADSGPVAVVDPTFGEQYWPGEDPIGKRIKFGSDPGDEEYPWMEVVGVVGHVASYGVHEESRIQMWIPFAQSPQPFAEALLRTEGDPRLLASTAERVVLGLDPDLPVAEVRTLEEEVGRTIAPQRVASTLLAVFAGLAVTLAVVGLYGLLAFAVAQRRREIGVRLAIGARGRDVMALILGQGFRLALLGVVLGLGLAVAGAPLVAAQLYQVRARDPWIFAGVAGLLTVVAVVASALPARRASRIEPAVALLEE